MSESRRENLVLAVLVATLLASIVSYAYLTVRDPCESSQSPDCILMPRVASLASAIAVAVCLATFVFARAVAFRSRVILSILGGGTALTVGLLVWNIAGRGTQQCGPVQSWLDLRQCSSPGWIVLLTFFGSWLLMIWGLWTDATAAQVAFGAFAAASALCFVLLLGGIAKSSALVTTTFLGVSVASTISLVVARRSRSPYLMRH